MTIWLKSVIIASVASTLTYASLRDLKNRDIPEVTWLPSLAIAVILNVLHGNYDVIHTALSLLPAALLFAMAIFNMIGGADFLAVLLIGLAHPLFEALPISLLALLYSLFIPLALMAYYVTLNSVKYRKQILRIRCIRGRRFYLYFLGRPISIGEFLNSKFMYPLTIPSGTGGFICRPTFSIDETEEAVKAEIMEFIDRGVIRRNDLIWVTPAMPHVAFLLIGYVLALITPQDLILQVFKLMT
ncbi:MAG: hypothetical protein B6U73_04885 [Desulfurococcales archaeon ex4484_204]|nr:MAG: hypothetical protein B6U73_04885 [Desulfurococcales archaeon ex4484_204]